MKTYTPLAIITAAFGILVGVACLATGARAAGKWTGCHLGVAGGYSVSNTKAAIDVPGGNLITVDGFAGEGLTGTALAGCDLQLDRLVLGAWADYNWHNADVALSAQNGTINIRSPLDSSWAVGGRAGLLFTPDTLVYGLAGYTRASFGDITLTSPGPNGSLSIGDFNGWMAGGGIETSLPIAGMSLDLRYTYAHYDRSTIAVGGPVFLGFEPVVHSVRAGISYRFNFDGSNPVPAIKP